MYIKTIRKVITMPANNNVRVLIAVLVSCLLLSIQADVSGAGSVVANKPAVGEAPPLFTVDDINGKRTSLEEILRDHNVVLLNFWGLRCSTCLEEIGYLNPLFDKYKGQGAVFIGVNVDGISTDLLKQNMPSLSNPPKFTVLADPDMKIPDLYNMLGAPLSFLIGRDGKIAYRHDDFKAGDEKELEAELKKALDATK